MTPPTAGGKEKAGESDPSSICTLFSYLTRSGVLRHGDSASCSTSLLFFRVCSSSSFSPSTELLNKLLGAPISRLRCTGNGLLQLGRRPLEVGRRGKAGGRSLGRSSLCLISSRNISSELRLTIRLAENMIETPTPLIYGYTTPESKLPQSKTVRNRVLSYNSEVKKRPMSIKIRMKQKKNSTSAVQGHSTRSEPDAESSSRTMTRGKKWLRSKNPRSNLPFNVHGGASGGPNRSLPSKELGFAPPNIQISGPSQRTL